MPFTINRGKNEPVNRYGSESGTGVKVTEGDLIGYVEDGEDGYEYGLADAASGTAVPAVGIAFTSVKDLADYVGENSDDLLDQLASDTVYENATLLGDRLAHLRDGVEMKHDDDTVDFTPGEPVYLDTDGGFTQTAPSASGDLVQVVGTALAPDPNGYARFELDVARVYETVA